MGRTGDEIDRYNAEFLSRRVWQTLLEDHVDGLLIAGLVALVLLGFGILLMVKGDNESARTLVASSPSRPRMVTSAPRVAVRTSTIRPRTERRAVAVRTVRMAAVHDIDDDYEAPTEVMSASGIQELLEEIRRR